MKIYAQEQDCQQQPHSLYLIFRCFVRKGGLNVSLILFLWWIFYLHRLLWKLSLWHVTALHSHVSISSGFLLSREFLYQTLKTRLRTHTEKISIFIEMWSVIDLKTAGYCMHRLWHSMDKVKMESSPEKEMNWHIKDIKAFLHENFFLHFLKSIIKTTQFRVKHPLQREVYDKSSSIDSWLIRFLWRGDIVYQHSSDSLHFVKSNLFSFIRI